MFNSKDLRIHKSAIIKRPELVKFGNHIAIDPFFYLTCGMETGNNIHISSHVSIIGGDRAKLILGDCVAISTGCRLICRSEDFTERGYAIPWVKEHHAPQYGSGITIGEGVILGANVVVLPDSAIGDWAVVGANSVVKGYLEPYGIYAGSPAKKIGVRK